MKGLIVMCMSLMIFSAASAFAAEPDEVTKIMSGTSRADIHAMIGTPKDGSNYGDKEIYSLSDGCSAVLRYIGESFNMGFILVD